VKQNLTALPLAGVGGWKSTELAKFHPLPPASGGNSPCKPKTLRKNFNISPLVKQNLTTLPFKGGNSPCKLKSLGKYLKPFFYFLVLLLAFTSCGKENAPTPNPPEEEITAFPKGVFISNEGAFNNGNASVSFYDLTSQTVQEKIYESKNNQPLGDVLQSITFDGKKGYLVLNNSSKIEIIRTADFKSVRTIDNLNSPRYLQVIDETTAYVSDLYQNAISVIDLNTDTEKAQIEIGSWSEQMIKMGNQVFVTQPSLFNQKSSNQIFVINANSNEITDSIAVGYNPVAMVLDKNNRLWVICNGEFDDATKLGGLYKINPSTMEVETAFPFTDNQVSFAPRLAINGAKDQLYFLKLDVFNLAIDAIALPETPLIDANGRDLYGLGVNPETSDIFVGDSGNFVQRGTVTVHNSAGQELTSFKAGVGVNGFYFQ